MFSILHVDVNSAYLSWEAVYRLQHGARVDLREIPAVVGGDEASRHGIVLAKSIPAKKFDIQTGETLFSARQKCPGLVVVSPNYKLYMQCSDAMNDILREYSPVIQRYSIDESFMHYQPAILQPKNFREKVMEVAQQLRRRIREELGFTVNIGIGPNKLLAKMASEFRKPDQIHTLYRHEIAEKMWPLPVSELFFVGRATTKKLFRYNVLTIGDLAKTNPDLIHRWLKKPGLLIWQYANGLDDSQVTEQPVPIKSIGNSNTLAFDVADRKTAHQILLALSETVGKRIRHIERSGRVVSVTLRSAELVTYRKQSCLEIPIDSTTLIWKEACRIFDETWKREALRHMGIHLSGLCSNDYYQLSLLQENEERFKKLDQTIDKLRQRFGDATLFRGCFSHSPIQPLMGGVIQEEETEYPMMSSYL